MGAPRMTAAEMCFILEPDDLDGLAADVADQFIDAVRWTYDIYCEDSPRFVKATSPPVTVNRIMFRRIARDVVKRLRAGTIRPDRFRKADDPRSYDLERHLDPEVWIKRQPIRGGRWPKHRRGK